MPPQSATAPVARRPDAAFHANTSPEKSYANHQMFVGQRRLTAIQTAWHHVSGGRAATRRTARRQGRCQDETKDAAGPSSAIAAVAEIGTVGAAGLSGPLQDFRERLHQIDRHWEHNRRILCRTDLHAHCICPQPSENRQQLAAKPRALQV